MSGIERRIRAAVVCWYKLAEGSQNAHKKLGLPEPEEAGQAEAAGRARKERRRWSLVAFMAGGLLGLAAGLAMGLAMGSTGSRLASVRQMRLTNVVMDTNKRKQGKGEQDALAISTRQPGGAIPLSEGGTAPAGRGSER